MNAINLIPADDLTGCPFPFFGGSQKPAKAVYKIYNDGGHFVATRIIRKATRKPQDCTLKSNSVDKYGDKEKAAFYSRIMRERTREKEFKKLYELAHKKGLQNDGDNRKMTEFILLGMLEKYPHCTSAYVEQKIIEFSFVKPVFKLKLVEGKNGCARSALDILFDSLYYTAFKQGLKDGKLDKSMTDFIREGILKLYPDFENLDEYIADKIKRKANNLLHRKKRFRRKANLNRWNYFVTFTYDDTKHTAETFKKKLRKCLSNLHTRRGWKYMGVFEQAPETGRLHFHGLIYVPVGEMLGSITEIQDYDTVNHRLQTRHENKFFADNFGINDFCEVSVDEMKNGKRIEYILKYIGKTNERICYSKGIPTEICRPVDGNDIITEMYDFVDKYILFDDVIDWERDVMRYRYNKQMSIIDLLCNPPLSA